MLHKGSWQDHDIGKKFKYLYTSGFSQNNAIHTGVICTELHIETSLDSLEMDWRNNEKFEVVRKYSEWHTKIGRESFSGIRTYIYVHLQTGAHTQRCICECMVSCLSVAAIIMRCDYINGYKINNKQESCVVNYFYHSFHLNAPARIFLSTYAQYHVTFNFHFFA